MKLMKKPILIAAIVLIVSTFSACEIWDGSETPVDEFASESISNDASQPDSSQASNSTNESTNSNSSAQTEKTTFEEVTVTNEDKEANIDKFIGNWEDTSDSSRYCIIKKTEIGYSYSDNESTFPAEVKDGVLQINIEVDNAFATGEVDETAGTLTIKYQDTETVFQKKK